jgi:ferredoxin
MIKKLGPAVFESWVEGLVRRPPVFGVQADGERFEFGPVARAADLRLDYDVAKTPPKKYFQPPAEDLLRFDRQARYTSVIAAEPFLLLGVHPYDMVAILQMDRVFTQDHPDAHYLARRHSATIVVSDVEKASANVFAACMNAATVRDGFDLLLTRIGEEYLAEARSPKGEGLLAGLGAPDADPTSLARREQVWDDNRRFLRRHDLRMLPSEIPALLERSMDHPVWEEKARLCFSCGSCTQTCPTCYCFDVRDDLDWNLQGGVRRRFWDSCQLVDFATVSGGHNFRKDVADRYRHRYYRKGAYVPAKIGGQIACVGCGRCITACVPKIAHPVEVFNRLLEVK